MADTITHHLLSEEALKRHWSIEFYGEEEKFLRITDLNGKQSVFRGTRPDGSSANGVDVTRDKSDTLDFVQTLGYKIPTAIKTNSPKAIEDFLREHKTIVIKPVDSDKSQGVTVDISNADQIEPALSYAQLYSSTDQVIAQVQLTGRLYRIFVLDGIVVAVAERRAASVTGDGVSTVRELIDALNADPRRGIGSKYALQTIDSATVEEFLGTDRLADVVQAGEEVRISNIDSVSAGGSSINVTGDIHQSWIDATTRITTSLGLVVAGFDVIVDDIAEPLVDGYMPLLEINSRPGLKLHEYPLYGDPIHIAPKLLDAVFR